MLAPLSAAMFGTTIVHSATPPLASSNWAVSSVTQLSQPTRPSGARLVAGVAAVPVMNTAAPPGGTASTRVRNVSPSHGRLKGALTRFGVPAEPGQPAP